MKQLKIFSAVDPISLQSQVNEWLSNNKGLDILSSGITSFATPDQKEYTFYILHSKYPHPVADAAVIVEHSLSTNPEIPDINKDISPQAN